VTVMRSRRILINRIYEGSGIQKEHARQDFRAACLFLMVECSAPTTARPRSDHDRYSQTRPKSRFRAFFRRAS